MLQDHKWKWEPFGCHNRCNHKIKSIAKRLWSWYRRMVKGLSKIQLLSVSIKGLSPIGKSYWLSYLHVWRSYVIVSSKSSSNGSKISWKRGFNAKASPLYRHCNLGKFLIDWYTINGVPVVSQRKGWLIKRLRSI